MATGLTGYLGSTNSLTPVGSTGWGQPIRVYRTSTGAAGAFATTAPRRTTWYGCFNANQIPAGATINGVEIHFSGNVGTAGSTGAGEAAYIEYRLWNGTSYSSVVYSANHEGANDYVHPIIGSSTDLHGLSWNEADQANFGFDVELVAITATPVVVVSREIPMRIWYTEAGGGSTGSTFGHTSMSGVYRDSVGSVNNIRVNNINSINKR